MLRIRRSANGEVVFTLSGQMDEEDIAGLETLIQSEENGLGIVLDLRNLTLVGRDAVGFLERCEAHGITLTNCSGYVREWITRLRSATLETTVQDGKE
jgi:anti-anti-sigma regulatory factor